MEEPLVIRLIEPSDDEAVWEIFAAIALAGETYAYDPGITRAEAIALWVVAPTATYVAVQANKIIGTYYIKPNQPGLGSHVCNCGYMVSPTAQGRGVATALCQHSQTEAQRLGFRAMQFNLVVSSNTTAVRLWQTLGFKIVGTLPGAFRHLRLGFVDAYVMYQQFDWIQDEAFGVIPVFQAPDRQYLLIRHTNGHWGFPKGHADAGESAEQAAQREFQEETGLSACRLFPGLQFTETYRFLTQKRNRRIEKTVIYFVGEVLGNSLDKASGLPHVKIQQKEISEFRWCPYAEAQELLTYEVGKEVLRACEAALVALS